MVSMMRLSRTFLVLGLPLTAQVAWAVKGNPSTRNVRDKRIMETI